MLFNFQKEESKESWISHLMAEGLADAIEKNVDFEKYITKDGSYDLKLTIQGIEIDLEKIIEFWQSQVERMIEDRAKELLENKFLNLQRDLQELQERVINQNKKFKYNWEK